MDHLVCLQGIAELSPANPEFTIDLPEANWQNLLDIRLQLSGVPCIPPVDHYYNPSGINVWFGTKNITQSVRTWIAEDLNKRGAVSRKQFADSVNSLRALWRKSVIAPQITHLSDADAKGLTDTKWSTFFSSLGDGKSGPAGVFHPFNFVFSRVSATPYSFRAALTKEGDPRKPVLSDQLDRRLVLTAVDRLIQVDRIPDLSLTRPVRINYSLELEYKDPFEEYVTAELAKLAELLGPTGPIQTALAQQASVTQTLKDELWQTALKSQGIPAAIDRLQKLLEDMRPELKS